MTVVCAASELAPGTLVAATVDEQPVVVVRTAAGELHAWVDRCLHQGARLSGGRLLALTEGEDVGEYRMAPDAEVLKCPWHGYEYDVRSGCGLFDRRRRLRRVAVDERDGMIVVLSRRATALSASSASSARLDMSNGVDDGDNSERN